MYSWWKNFVIFRIQFNWRAKIGKKPGIPSNRYRQQCRKDRAGVDQYLRIFALHAVDADLRIAAVLAIVLDTDTRLEDQSLCQCRGVGLLEHRRKDGQNSKKETPYNIRFLAAPFVRTDFFSYLCRSFGFTAPNRYGRRDEKGIRCES